MTTRELFTEVEKACEWMRAKRNATENTEARQAYELAELMLTKVRRELEQK